MSDDEAALRDELHALLASRAFRYGDFVLTSGRRSDYYVDGKQVTLHGRGLYLIARLGLARCRELGVDAVGGLALGADPIASAIAALSGERGGSLDAFIVRKEVKPHGTASAVEGPRLHDGVRVALVDDTLTTGGTLLQARDAVVAQGAAVVGAICVIDREEGGREALEAAGIALHALFSRSEFAAPAPAQARVTLRVNRFQDASAFVERVLPFLMADEARNNLLIGILTTLLERPSMYPRRHLATVDDDGEVAAAMLLTPPFENSVISDLLPRRAPAEQVAGAAGAAIAEGLPGARGLVGNAPHAAPVAAACAERVGGRARRDSAMGSYRADRVLPLFAPPGALRPAEPGDRDLVLRWYAEFAAEAHRQQLSDVVIRQVDDRLRRMGAGIDLWEQGGIAVSMCAYAISTPNGARIGPVYTPPASRRRGYASALVAATTQRLLDEGRTFCFLNTDLANPTANHIYTAIGYVWVCEVEEWRFDRH